VTYLTDVLNHDTQMTMACTNDLLSNQLPSHAGVKHHRFWADVGRHFRSYEMMGFWLDQKATQLRTAQSLAYQADGHGKNVLDGHFGRMRAWTEIIAKKHTVSTHTRWAELLQERAERYNSQDFAGAELRFIAFTPPPKKTLKAQAIDGPSMGILCTRTFFISSHLSKGNNAIISNHVLAGSPAQKSQYPKYTHKNLQDQEGEEAEEEDAYSEKGKVSSDGWRRVQRISEPEKAPPMVKKMERAFAVCDIAKLEVHWCHRHRTWEEAVEAEVASRTARKKPAAVK